MLLLVLAHHDQPDAVGGLEEEVRLPGTSHRGASRNSEVSPCLAMPKEMQGRPMFNDVVAFHSIITISWLWSEHTSSSIIAATGLL